MIHTCFIIRLSYDWFEFVNAGPSFAAHINEKKNHTLKIIGMHAKRARGLMVDFIIRHQIKDPEALKAFTRSGYEWHPDHSTDTEWVFARE